MKLYERIAQTIEKAVESRVYAAGDRLPSVRQLSSDLGASVSTVLGAYHLLEARGLVEARPQSGHYITRLANSATRLRTSRWSLEPTLVDGAAHARTMMSLLDNAGNDQIVQLGIAQTAADLLPATPLASAARSVLRRGGAEHLAYGRPAGEAALAVQVARLLMCRGCQIDPDELVITNGCQQALMLALLAVAEPGDTVAVESPTYPGMLHAIEALGMQVIEIPSDPTTGICLDALRSAIGQWPVRACYVMPTVSNPLGSSMCESDRRGLIQLLSEAQIPLIEDDTTAGLQFAERASTPLKAHDMCPHISL